MKQIEKLFRWLCGPSEIEKERERTVQTALKKLEETREPAKRLRLLRTIKDLKA